MKKLILLAFGTIVLYGNLTAINQDSITLSMRKKAYDRYHEVKDTVTVRTWMNMDRMNKALIKVVEYDNQLLESSKINDSINTNTELARIDTIGEKPTEKLKPLLPATWFEPKYLLAAFIALGIIILILIVLLVKRSFGLKKLQREYNEREETFDSKLNRLEYLENEVAKMKTRENEVKTELEKGIVDYQEKMLTLRKRIQELADENTRLEGLNLALSEGKVIEGDTSIAKSEEIKQEIIVELEGILKRVKKSRK